MLLKYELSEYESLEALQTCQQSKGGVSKERSKWHLEMKVHGHLYSQRSC